MPAVVPGGKARTLIPEEVPGQAAVTSLDETGRIRYRNTMDFVRKTRQVGPVWLTALMTLVAGIPHFHCRCPDGHLKSFCLGAPSKPTGCCCGSSCCSGSPGGGCCGCQAHAAPQPGTLVKRPGCCAQSHGQPTSKAPDNRCRIESAGCQKTPAPAQVVIVTPAKRAVAEDLTAGLF